MNKTRQLYHKILGHNNAREAKTKIIQEGRELKSMMETQGWKHLSKFIDKQKAGTTAFMDHEVGNINTFSLIGLFNTYIKYLYFLMERRAYRKIETYLSVTVANAEKYELELIKEEERKNRGNE